MSDYRTILERARNEFPAPEMSLDGILRRCDRRRRSRQIGALVFTLILLAIVVGGAVGVLRSSARRVPANQSENPTPPANEKVPSPDLGRFDIPVAWGESSGVVWTIWANEDLSCMAFTREGGNDSGCGDGYDESDLMLPTPCMYACPVPRQPILYGLVSQRVATVELMVDDGDQYVGTIHPAPSGIRVDARVFTVPTNEVWGGFTGTLTATGAGGEVLGQMRFPWNADAAGGASMPMSVEATLASGVRVSEVDGRTIEEDRWEIAIWRTAADDWCLGTIFPYYPSAMVATAGQGCGPRESLFDGIRAGAIGHADVWYSDLPERGWWSYRVSGTVSDEVAAVRIEVEGGLVVEADLYDPPPGFEDMGRLFIAEFRSKLHPWSMGGEGGITWRAIALDANGQVLGSDKLSI